VGLEVGPEEPDADAVVVGVAVVAVVAVGGAGVALGPVSVDRFSYAFYHMSCK
jgi:hypothetical protein